MTELLQIYKCEICGNVVEMLHTGESALVCCGQPMKLQVADSVDAALEKHVPVIEKWQNGYHVKIGSAPHPSIETHYIEWIELIADDRTYKKFLKPGDKPEAFFDDVKGEKIEAREYCNLHGLWKADLQ